MPRKRRRFNKRQAMVCGSALGLILEDEVETYLKELLAGGFIASYVRHSRHSLEDCSGRDFTVGKQVRGILVYVSFGVTISAERCLRSRDLHWPVPQFWFPIWTDKTLIVKTILDLFKPLSV
ncbi:MAG: hypothetical protein WC673_00960 [Candidatus Paceibacterota bacterium]